MTRINNKYLCVYYINDVGNIYYHKKRKINSFIDDNGDECINLYSSKDGKLHKYYVDVLKHMTFNMEPFYNKVK